MTGTSTGDDRGDGAGSAAVTLDAPLGDRTLVDGVTGREIPLDGPG